jgi:hypothetical protein
MSKMPTSLTYFCDFHYRSGRTVFWGLQNSKRLEVAVLLWATGPLQSALSLQVSFTGDLSISLCLLMPGKWDCSVSRDCSISLMVGFTGSLRTSPWVLGILPVWTGSWAPDKVSQTARGGKLEGTHVWTLPVTVLNSWCLWGMLQVWSQMIVGWIFRLCKGLAWLSSDAEISETLIYKRWGKRHRPYIIISSCPPRQTQKRQL